MNIEVFLSVAFPVVLTPFVAPTLLDVLLFVIYTFCHYLLAGIGLSDFIGIWTSSLGNSSFISSILGISILFCLLSCLGSSFKSAISSTYTLIIDISTLPPNSSLNFISSSFYIGKVIVAGYELKLNKVACLSVLDWFNWFETWLLIFASVGIIFIKFTVPVAVFPWGVTAKDSSLRQICELPSKNWEYSASIISKDKGRLTQTVK